MNAAAAQILGAAAALAALLFLLMRRGGKASRQPYQKQAALFSDQERAFFLALKDAAGAEYEIFAKIPVGDLIAAKKDAARAAAGPISGKRFDFVLCDKTSLAAVCAIQLRQRPPRADAPAEALQAICEHLALPLLRFPAQADYSAAELRPALCAALAKTPLHLAETDGRKEPRISNFDDLKF